LAHRVTVADRRIRFATEPIGRLFTWTIHFRRQERNKWEGGFKAYDELSEGKLDTVSKYPSFIYFAQFVDLLIEDAKQCTLEEDFKRE